MLIGKLPKSSFSALLEPNTKSFPLRLVLSFGLIQTVLPQLVLCFCWPKKSAVRGPSVNRKKVHLGILVYLVAPIFLDLLKNFAKKIAKILFIDEVSNS